MPEAPSLQSRTTLAMLGVFPFLILVYAAAIVAERLMPIASVTLVLCLVALGLPVVARAEARFNRSQAIVLGAGLLGVLLPAWVQWWDGAPISVWWKSGERLLALTLAACLMTTPLPLSRLLHVFLASGSLAMVLAFIGIWSGGGLSGDLSRSGPAFWYNFGLGNPNQLVNTVGLAACGHLVWLIASRRQGLTVPRASVVLAVFGCAATLVLALVTARRGIILAGLFGATVLGISLLWRSHRAWAWGIILTLVLLGAAGVAYGLGTMHTEARSERGLQYLANLEFGGDRWWLGHGHYASRLSQFVATDACATYNALGNWSLSAHNEPLDALIDAGVIGLLLCVGIILFTWRQCLAGAPGRERSTLIFLVAGATVIACLDNAYSRLIGMWWLACLIGFVFHAQEQGSGQKLPFVRPFAWTVALLAALATTTLTSSALMSSTAPPTAHMQTVRDTIEPDLLTAHARIVVDTLEEEGEWSAVDEVLELQSQRLGPTHNSLYRQVLARLNAGRPDDSLVAPLLLLAQGAIFDASVHRQIASLLVRRPDMATRFPPHVCERAARWMGFARLPRLSLPFASPVSAEDAATQLAQLGWALQYQGGDPGLGTSLRQLFDAYPTSRQTVGLILQYLILTEQPDIPLDANRIVRLVRSYPIQFEGKILASITTREQALRLRPILAVRYRDVVLDLELQQVLHTQELDQTVRVLRLADLGQAASP